MTLHYADDWLTVHLGDCREVMASMEPESVHCVVTSPPYWGLRDYGTATWVGGDAECDHLRPIQNRNERPAGIFHGGSDDGNDSREPRYKERCGKCGAIRQDGQLGLEPTPEAYVEALVAVFREVRRVLRKDGTVWLNLGDSYAANGISGLGIKGDTSTLVGTANAAHTAQVKTVPTGLKPKDLVGIPWRVAFALQADGWYLRSDIIWAKPNPMPESVTDRPTKAHEYVFLLSKSARYYFDADAVRETAIYEGVTVKASNPDTAKNGAKGTYGATAFGFTQHDTVVSGRNLRSVWTIATQPYPGAHFATFPRALVEPCIKAGCPEYGVVLDPFAGSGTVGLVAQSLSRRAVLIDLNADYLGQVMDRNRDIPLGLA